MKKSLVISSIALLTIASGCRHKDLCFDSGESTHINVVFNWRDAPDAAPKSMSMTLFGMSDEDPIEYNFSNKTGGEIRVPTGFYNSICLNSDFSDWAQLRNTGTEFGYELLTSDASTMEGMGIPSRSLPRSGVGSDERMATTPGMAWAHNVDNIDLSLPMEEKTIVYYPKEIVCHYIVDVIDVENPEYIGSAQIDGTLSGMAEGYHVGQHATTDNSVTHPFLLSIDEGQPSTLHAEFLTFGECNTVRVPHTLTIYLPLNNGTLRSYIFDVSDQIRKAPDPTHVHIIVRGVSVPKPIGSGGGFIPNVNDWEIENIYIKM